jgi:hypothetical protein
MTDKKHTTPAASVEILQKQVADLQEYVAGTIRRRESARIKTLEELVQTLQAEIDILDQQLKNVQSTFFQVTGSRRQNLPIVEVE